MRTPRANSPEIPPKCLIIPTKCLGPKSGTTSLTLFPRQNFPYGHKIGRQVKVIQVRSFPRQSLQNSPEVSHNSHELSRSKIRNDVPDVVPGPENLSKVLRPGAGPFETARPWSSITDDTSRRNITYAGPGVASRRKKNASPIEGPRTHRTPGRLPP